MRERRLRRVSETDFQSVHARARPLLPFLTARQASRSSIIPSSRRADGAGREEMRVRTEIAVDEGCPPSQLRHALIHLRQKRGERAGRAR